ncbi:hypothetical protein ACFL4T_08350 [candidate division KSB1 bacterium]
MRKIFYSSVLIIIIILLSSSLVFSQLSVLKTKDLNLIYYSSAHTYIMPHLARCFTNTLGYYKKFWDYTPAEEITILFQDFSDWGNAGATSVPVNYIGISIAPFLYVYEVGPANERMSWLMNHELVHVIACDKASKTDRFYRSLFFGKVSPTSDNPLSMVYAYLTCPRRYSPRWYHEGIAVFMETWMSGGYGRVLGFYDEMVFRSMVRDKSYIYDVIGIESEGTAVDFQVGANAYLYGTRFFSYLGNKFGPEKLIDWTSRTDGSKRYFASQFEKVFNNSLDSEWSNWIDWERKWQEMNLDSIRNHPTTGFREITEEVLGSVSRAYYDKGTGKIYVAIRYPGQVAHIASLDIKTGDLEKICDVKGASVYYVCSLTYDPTTGTIFYTTDNNNWRDLNAVNVKTGKSKRLITDLRTGNLTFNLTDKSIWGIRHSDGISTIIKVDPPYKDWTAVYALPYGLDIYDIDISPDGKILTAAVANISGLQKLVKFDMDKLLQGDSSYDELFDFDISSPANFVFSDDGNYLYGTSYFTGVSNVFRYDFTKKEMEVLSNCESGFFRPVPTGGDSLIVFRYTGKGFVPVWIKEQTVEDVSAIKFLGQEIVEKYPVVTEWVPGSPSSVDLDSHITYQGPYSSWKNIGLSSAYPLVEGYKNYTSMGYRFNFRNEVGYNGFDMTASYTPQENVANDEKLHFGLNYHYWAWKISAKYNTADFYDLFGPTKTSRKGYSLGLEYSKSLVYDKPKQLDIHFKIAGYGGLERLPSFQNVAAAFDKLVTSNIGLDYSYLKRSLGAVDYEKGVKFNINLRSNYVNSKLLSRIYSNFDCGILLPINHSSIWLRTSFGYSSGHRSNVFANFYFGGFGNNWVDYQEEKRYREYYSFPGAEINDIGGKTFGKAMFEWTLPPIRFRRFGFLNLYCNWARIALFSSGIITNFNDDLYKRKLMNIGAQIDFKLVIFSLMDASFSMGYAAAFEKNFGPRKEFMASLKIY